MQKKKFKKMVAKQQESQPPSFSTMEKYLPGYSWGKRSIYWSAGSVLEKVLFYFFHCNNCKMFVANICSYH